MGRAFRGGKQARIWHTVSTRRERESRAKMRAVNVREVDRLDHEKKVNWARHMALLSKGSTGPRTEEGEPGA